MKTKSFFLTPEVHGYILDHIDAPDALQAELIEETAKLGPIAMMQIAPEQGAFMELLVRTSGARRAIEVGTFTGYSALCIARALGPGGKLLCLDTSADWTAIARRYWQRDGIADRIELRLGPGAETLASLPRETLFDFGFIDADKPAYRTYYEEILARLRPGGLIVCDNVLWNGRVVDPNADDPQTREIRAFNDFVARDARVDRSMIAVGDGLMIARKR
jgi:caffeoyl-CoA O-methyltransferase